MIYVDADINVRFKRYKTRARFGDKNTLEDFIKHHSIEESDIKIPELRDKIFKMCNVSIINNWDCNLLYSKLDQIIDNEIL